MENMNVKEQNNRGNKGFQRKERTSVLRPSGYNYKVQLSQINEFLISFFEEQGIQGIYGPLVDIEREGRLDSSIRIEAYLMMDKNSPDVQTNKVINTKNVLPQAMQRQGGGKSKPSARLSDALVQVGQFEMEGDKPHFISGAVNMSDGKKVIFFLDIFKILALMTGSTLSENAVNILSAKKRPDGDGIIDFSVNRRTKRFNDKTAQMRAIAKKLKSKRG